MGNLAPYLFVEINKKIAAKKALGEEVINFSIGDPDIPTPENVINKMPNGCRPGKSPLSGDIRVA
jgi:aspartate/methionine/tyrosine aminotransferase